MNIKKLNMLCLKMITKTYNISVNSRMLKNYLVSLLKEKLLSGILGGSI